MFQAREAARMNIGLFLRNIHARFRKSVLFRLFIAAFLSIFAGSFLFYWAVNYFVVSPKYHPVRQWIKRSLPFNDETYNAILATYYVIRVHTTEAVQDSLLFFQDLPYIAYRFQEPALPVYELTVAKDDLRELNRYFQKQMLNPDRKKRYKKAIFSDGEKSYKVDVSYRGDGWGHFLYKKKSWRVRFPKDDYFEHMREVNFIIPYRRGWLAEALNHYRARKLSVAAPRSFFARLRVNGEDMGVYFVSEHFTKDLLEANRLSPDANLYTDDAFARPIYSDVLYWKKNASNPRREEEDIGDLSYFLDLLNNASDEEFWRFIPDILDMNNFYAWQVLSLLSGSPRQDITHNAALYMNPADGKFRFILTDLRSVAPSSSSGSALLYEGNRIDNINYNPVVERVLKNPEFLHERNKKLWEYVKDDANLRDDLAFYDALAEKLLPEFFADTKKRIANKELERAIAQTRNAFQRNYEEARAMLAGGEAHALIASQDEKGAGELLYSFAIDLVLQHIALVDIDGIAIEGAPKSVRSFLVRYDANGNNILDGEDPIVGRGICEEGSVCKAAIQKLRLQGGIVEVEPPREEVLARESSDFYHRTSLRPVSHRFFIVMEGGGAFQRAEEIRATVDLRNAVTEKMFSVAARAGENAFASTTVQKGTYWILDESATAQERVLGPGFVHVSENIVIPKGSALTIAPGTTLFMEPGVSILSYGPVHALGTQQLPIRIRAAREGGNPWGVFAIVGVQQESRFAYVEFEGGSEAELGNAFFSAMLAAHYSPVVVRHGVFRGAQGDDALNVKYAKAEVADTLFEDNMFDAIDFDFVDGAVKNSKFFANGNDGIDLSGSRVIVAGNTIRESGDKGISVGEASDVRIEENVIARGKIGIAVKDSSFASIVQNEISENEIGIALYRKKQIFGGGRAEVQETDLNNNSVSTSVDELSILNVWQP